MFAVVPGGFHLFVTIELMHGWPPLLKAVRSVAAMSLLITATPALVAASPYTRIDRIGDWVIERRQVSGGGHLCRAHIPSGGSWFSANVHLDPVGTLVVPPGAVHPANPSQLAAVREALERCRADLLYLP